MPLLWLDRLKAYCRKETEDKFDHGQILDQAVNAAVVIEGVDTSDV